MDMSDPLTADFPTRNLDQDEENAALSGAAASDRQPIIFWRSDVGSKFKDGKLAVKQLAAGAILHADQTEGPGIAIPTAADKVFLMYLLQDGASQHQQSEQNGNLEQPISQLSLDANQQTACSLLVFCQTELQPERATRWLQTLLQAVSPQHILVAASLPAFSYRGPGNPHEENLHYIVQTSAAAEKSQGKHNIPGLPSGSLATGLAAAAIQHAEVRQVAATALVGIDARPKPDLESLQQLALRLEQILAAHGSGIVQAKAMSNTVKQAHKSLAASASGSYMYI